MLHTDPGCLACHSAIEPAAASLFGFWRTIQYNPYEMQTYHPERELLGPELLGVEPAWFGAPMAGLVDLGWFVAADPRFDRCAAESFAAMLWRRMPATNDFTTIEELRSGFVATGRRPRALVSSVVDTPQYRAGGFTDDATDDVRARHRVERLMTPNQLGTVVEDISGFEWTWLGYRQLENDVIGYRTLRGGVDGYSVTQVQQDPGLTWSLVSKRVAQFAADAIVTRDLIDGEHRVLRGVDIGTRPDDAAFEDELASLHWRLYAERADDAWIRSLVALWEDVAASHTEANAWAAVVEAILRDPRFVSY
jgi:hypothetical protein